MGRNNNNNAVADNNNNNPVDGSADGHPIRKGDASSWWSRLNGRMNETADNFFYRMGYWVAIHTKLTLLTCFILVAACCSGFVNFEFVTDSEDLWVPSNSLSKKQERVVLSYFNDSSDYAVILVDSPSDGGNILTKDAMDALWELHSLVLEIKTNGKTYEDLCIKGTDGVTCAQNSRTVTRFWDDDFDTYEASVTSDADVLEAINVDTYPDGTTVSLEAVFGNTLEYNSTTGDVTSAGAMMQMYLLDANTDDAEDDAYKWMDDYQDFMGDLDDEYESIFGVEYITSRSIEDALTESVSGETFLFVTTYIIMIVFVSLAVGRCRWDSVHRRPVLGSAGVYVVVAAGLAAYGLNSGFEVPFTTLSIILPFILVGIGVDDMFVIVAAFDHTNPDLPVEERVALGLKRCGVSITYTSMTNFFAFMLGSTTCLPAVEYFCLYAGTAILFDFFLQLTAFVAVLTMDANRQKAGRFSFCCCFKSKALLEEQEKVQRGVVLPPEPECTGENGGAQGGRHAEIHELGPVGRFLKDKYTPAILSIPGKAAVLLGTLALLAAGIYGVTQNTQGFDVLDLAPDDHYARDYTELAREYDLAIDSQFVALGVYTLEVDYTDVDVQVQIRETDDLMEAQEFISGPIDSWLSSFVEWAANGSEYSANVSTYGGYSVFSDSSRFYAAVAEFVEDEDYERFQDDIVFKSDGSIEISRSWLFLVDIVDTDSNIDAIEQTRDVIDESTLDPEPFGFSSVFIFIEQFFVIYEELILNFVLALVAVAVLSLFILGDVAMVALICFTVFIVDVDLLGFVYYWGLDINGITVIELIMAVGLVVDYMVHIVHFFLHQDPNVPKDARIADALGEIGPSVMLGAATTFLGIMPLAFASNVIFRTFFKMFLIIITFGFFHGAVFIPVVLSLMPECCLMKNRGCRDGRQTKEQPAIESSI